VVWRYEVPDRKFEFWSSPAMGRVPGAAGAKPVDVAIIGGRDKLVHAIRLDDGQALWTFPTRAKVDASPVIARERVIAASFDGHLYLLDLKSGKEVWKFAAGGPFVASPAVADGRLVIGTDDGAVYCFDLRADAR
jgi:outer membrane protein assembly factor BamB